MFRMLATNIALTLFWYLLSTALSMWNKLLVGRDHGAFGGEPFPAPFFMSSVQFFGQYFLSTFVLATGLAARRRPRSHETSWREWTRTVLPNGIATGLDIGFSNYSLVFIQLSFYVMCKSTTPLFLLICAFAIGLERPSWILAAVVGIICGGLALLVTGEKISFNWTGFTLVMTAAALSGVRWTITQILLHGDAHDDDDDAVGALDGAKPQPQLLQREQGEGRGAGMATLNASDSTPLLGGDGPDAESAGLGASSSSALAAETAGLGASTSARANAANGPRNGAANASSSSSSSSPSSPPPPSQRQRTKVSAAGPVEVLLALTPVMGATLGILSLGFERPWSSLPSSVYFANAKNSLISVGFISAGAVIAFLMVWVEFALIASTSALTFMVAGTFKEIFTVAAAVIFLHETFTFVNALGVFVLLIGVSLFNWHKYTKLRAELKVKLASRPSDAELAAHAGAADARGANATNPQGAPWAGQGDWTHAQNAGSADDGCAIELGIGASAATKGRV